MSLHVYMCTTPSQLNQIIIINNHHIYTGNNSGSQLRPT